MEVLIVHAHPEPQSFNGAMTRTAVDALTKAGHTVQVSDLYALNFHAATDRSNFTTVADPTYLKPQTEENYASLHEGFAGDVEAEMRKLENADLLIFQFPLFWFHLPAILKGWVDRVFAMGRIYGGKVGIYKNGRFVGRKAMLSLTTGAPEASWTPEGMHGDIYNMLKPIHRGILEFVGYDVLKPQLSFAAAKKTAEEREVMLEAWRVRCATLAHEEPIVVGKY